MDRPLLRNCESSLALRIVISAQSMDRYFFLGRESFPAPCNPVQPAAYHLKRTGVCQVTLPWQNATYLRNLIMIYLQHSGSLWNMTIKFECPMRIELIRVINFVRLHYKPLRRFESYWKAKKPTKGNYDQSCNWDVPFPWRTYIDVTAGKCRSQKRRNCFK